MSQVSVCLSVVCLSRLWILSKRTKISSKFFNHRVAMFLVECRRKGRNLDSEPISRANISTMSSIACCERCDRLGAAGPWKAVTLTAGSKRRSLMMAGDDEEMFISRSLNVTPKTTEQHLIARSDKSVAYVTNNKRLCSTYCTIEANY